MKIYYYYGFASGPESSKARFFKEKFSLTKTIPFEIVDYIPDEDNFTTLRVSEKIETLITELATSERKDLVLFGSSFGAFLALNLAYRIPKRIIGLILMAPAIFFSAENVCSLLNVSSTEWKRIGHVYVEHFRFLKPVKLNYSFYQDLRDYSLPRFSEIKFSFPIQIFHGINDEIVPVEWSIKFAQSHKSVSLIKLNSNHQLSNKTQEIWEHSITFLEQLSKNV